MRNALFIIVFGTSLAAPLSATALEPLTVYLDGAKQASHEIRASDADLRASQDQQSAATWAFAPTLSVEAGYTRNQEEVAISLPNGTDATITKKNQLDLTATLRLPLFSPQRWTARETAAKGVDAAKADASVTRYDVLLRTVRAYEDLRSSIAIKESTTRALEVAKRALEDEKARVRANTATTLEVKRAEASVAQREQLLADAEFNIAQARRALERLSGVAVNDLSLSEDAGRPDPGAVEAWTALALSAPEYQAAKRRQEVAFATASQAKAAAFLPEIAAFATERVTNASGFGPSDQWSVGVTLNWSLDLATWRSKDQAVSTAEAQQIRTEYNAVLVRDGIADAFDAYKSALVSADAAKVEEDASLEASRIAQ